MKDKRYFQAILLTSVLSVLVVISIWLFSHTVLNAKSQEVLGISSTMTVQELTKYNGDDPNLPIYIGLNGLVYDVSSGRSFYDANGTYHYLAGKDSSSDLNLIGGDIILRKYKPISKLISN
jgi:predicted heme/steroid binding protein